MSSGHQLALDQVRRRTICVVDLRDPVDAARQLTTALQGRAQARLYLEAVADALDRADAREGYITTDDGNTIGQNDGNRGQSSIRQADGNTIISNDGAPTRGLTSSETLSRGVDTTDTPRDR